MRLPGLFGGVVFALTLSSSLAATVCTETELRAALASGGTITFGCDTQIVLTATLQVKTNTVLDASGRQVTLSGGGAVRIFEVANGVSLTLRNLYVVNGYAKGADEVSTPTVIPAADAFASALVATNAILSFQNCTFSNNIAIGGTAVLLGHPNRGGEAYGGAVFARGGELTVINSAFLTNHAVGGTIVAFSPGLGTRGQNPDGDAWGGAILASDAKLTVTDSIFTENSAFNGGGAIHARSNVITIAGTTFNKNSAIARTRARNVFNLESDGFGGAVELRSTAFVAITNSIFEGNFVRGAGGYDGSTKTLGGGALFSDSAVNIANSDFLHNYVEGYQQPFPVRISRGGAICIDAPAQISGGRFVANSVIGANAAAFAGGGNPGGDGFGGALFLNGNSQVWESAFISNSAGGGFNALGFSGPFRGAAQGGAIYSSNSFLAKNLTVAHTLTLHAAEHPQGGAVFCAGPGAATTNIIHYCTFATNQFQAMLDGWRPFQLAHAGAASNAILHLRGTIFSGGTSNTVTGDYIDGGYNITSDNLFTQTTSKNNTDPKLGPLGLYGGRSETFPVLASGPAANAVPSDFPPIDQRGRTRPHGSGAEIGAYEISPPFTAIGRFLRNIDYSEAQVSANGVQFEVASDRTFVAFFTNAGPLTPSADGIIFAPENISLEPGIERFDLAFTGYVLNELAIEGQSKSLTINFAAETAGSYELQSSSNLTDWILVETTALTANSLYTKEIAASGSPLFYRVQKN
ncbi:MAG TPA: choice-of-anchor Q domain-containing protein [Verrucomicrobiae bacterium]